MEELFRQVCKNCGAEFVETDAVNGVIKCRYCHSAFTIPKKETTPAALSFLRQGEHDLDTCRFDDAYTAYEKAASLDNSEPEAYFGMALAEFKVQYIKDTVNNCLQPICHEITDKVFSESKNFKRALELATSAQRIEYERKGCDIDDIGKEFYKLKQSGLDYDCFICVKVTDDETKTRTADYKDADDIYFELRGKGFKPFFSERELRGVAGADYEARILYALYSSECMLVVCSREEYLRTPWVKNEYTRFLKLVNDEEKESDSITIVYSGKPIEKLPGKNGKIQGIDIRSLSAMESIASFVERHSDTGKSRRESEERRKREQEEANERRLRELEERLKQTYSSPQPAQERETKKCEHCGEWIDGFERVCPVCGGNKFKYKADIEREKREAELQAKKKAWEAKQKAEEEAKRRAEKEEAERKANEKARAKQEYERTYKEWAKINDPDLNNYDSTIFEIQSARLVKYKGKNLTKVIIPRGVKFINTFAFKDCRGITDITLPDTLNTICDMAFSKCKSLTSLKIPGTVAEIGQFAFADCSSLTDLEISRGVQTIKYGAFGGLEKLESVVIPDGISKMEKNVFLSGFKVITIYCEAESKPEGWHNKWARRFTGFGGDNNVVWGYKKP